MGMAKSTWVTDRISGTLPTHPDHGDLLRKQKHGSQSCFGSSSQLLPRPRLAPILGRCSMPKSEPKSAPNT